jgi:branched-chain amino acid transport system substrate-binding protein
VWLVSALLIVCGCSKEQPAQQSSNAEARKIVAIVSSLSGDLAANGKDMANGAAMAFDDAAKAGGVSVGYEIFDDQGDPKAAVSVANRVCQDSRFVAVVGHLTSGCMSAAAAVYARARMAVIMPVPTNPAITRQGYTNLFRIPPTDDEQAPFLARYLLKTDPSAPVAVVHDLTAYGQGFATAFRAAYDASENKVVAFEGAQKELFNFRDLIAKLKALHPKYIVLGATYDMAAPFAKQLRELGLEATILSGDGCYSSEFIKQGGKAVEGSIVSFIAPDRESSAATEKFFTVYEKRFAKVVSFAPLGYDAGEVAIAAVRKAKPLTRESVLNALRDPQFSIDGVTGKIQFGENGDNKNKNLVLYTVRDGKFVLLK